MDEEKNMDEEKMPSRDAVQALMIIGGFALAIIFAFIFNWVLVDYYIPTHDEHTAGALIPLVIIPLSILLGGILGHYIGYKIIRVKYGQDAAESLVFFNEYRKKK